MDIFLYDKLINCSSAGFARKLVDDYLVLQHLLFA